MSRSLRIGLGVLLGIAVVLGAGIGFAVLLGTRPDIGNADLATVQRTLPGTWNLQETTHDDFIAGLVDEFDAADLQEQLDGLKIGDPVRISLALADGTITASSTADGMTTTLGDGTYEIVDNHTLKVTRGDCTVNAQFRLREDVLTFGIIGACPTDLSDITLAVLLRGAPFNRGAES